VGSGKCNEFLSVNTFMESYKNIPWGTGEWGGEWSWDWKTKDVLTLTAMLYFFS
jgi:hypothetical protein